MDSHGSDPLPVGASRPPTSRPVDPGPAVHRLGPLVTLEPLAHPLWGRCYAAAVGAIVLGVLLVAWSLTPAERLGTHRQLGLPPCGMVTMTGLPCPTCGMTTAYALVVRGRLLAAVRAQPMGAILALATVGAALVSLLTVVLGRYPAINWYRVNPVHLVWWTVLAFILGWGATIALGLLDGTLPVQYPGPG